MGPPRITDAVSSVQPGLLDRQADRRTQGREVIAGLGDARTGDGNDAFDQPLATRQQIADLRQRRDVEYREADIGRQSAGRNLALQQHLAPESSPRLRDTWWERLRW